MRLDQLSVSDWIAAAALVIALVSLGVSWHTRREERAHWRATNLARVTVIDAHFVSWRAISAEEARATNWGFAAQLTSSMREHRLTGEYLLLNRPIAFDPSSGQNITGTTSIAVEDLTRELVELGHDPSKLALRQYFQIEFEFENTGLTHARNLETEILGYIPNTQTWQSLGVSQPIDLGPAKRVIRLAELFVPITGSLPDRLQIRARMSFQNAEGERVETEDSLYYVPQTASWKVGE